MKAHLLFIGIILILLMILMALDRSRNLEEAFGEMPAANQSSYLSSEIPGAVTANPTVTKPTTKEVIDAQETVRMFMNLCGTVAKQTITEKQTCLNLKFRAPIFMNELDALLTNPDIVDASRFYKTVAEYKQAVQRLKQIPSEEGFTSQTILKDAANLLDAISLFEEAYAQKDTKNINVTNNRNFVNDLHLKAKTHSVNIQKPNLPKDATFQKQVQLLTSDYQRGLYILLDLPNKAPPSVQSSGTATSDKITVQGVKDLISNIQAEQLRLQNLRSSDATVLARIRLLEQLLADLREIVGKVERKEMDASQIPIKASDATEFLGQYKSSDKLPYLMAQTGSAVGTQNVFSQPHGFKSGTEITELPLANRGLVEGPTGSDQGLQTGPVGPMIPTEVLQYLKNLKWSMDIKVHSDPGIAYRERTMDRIKELEQRIAAYAYNDVPIPYALQKAFKHELEALTKAITMDYISSDDIYENYNNTADDSDEDEDTETSYKSYRSSTNASASQKPNTRTNRISSTHTRMISDTRDGMSDYNPFSNEDKSNPDAMLNPGFIMSSDTIKHRGSASYFDDSAVGGLDYKQRSKNLCRQIESASLGEPTTFGCVENSEAVSSTYSWKGNFEMICNRLGDTWGGWYPEMFGCPKYDPTMKYSGAQL